MLGEEDEEFGGMCEDGRGGLKVGVEVGDLLCLIVVGVVNAASDINIVITLHPHPIPVNLLHIHHLLPPQHSLNIPHIRLLHTLLIKIHHPLSKIIPST